MSNRPVFARPMDAHCAVYHVLTVAAYALAFALWLNPEHSGLDSLLGQVLFVGTVSPLLGWISAVDLGVNYHNHAHRVIFRRRWMNRWFERTWGVVAGWPAFLWCHSHVAVHHRFFMGPEDWSIPRRRADGRFEPLWSYSLFHWPWRTAYHLLRDFRYGRLARRRTVVEVAWFAVFWSIPFMIDPWMALWLWVLPQVFANTVTLAVGMYVQHAGCEAYPEAPDAAHSNQFLAPLYNRTMFNIGYHAVHHEHPGAHWSELPTFDRDGSSAAALPTVELTPVGSQRSAGHASPSPAMDPRTTAH